MSVRQLYTTSVMIPLLLTATALCGQQTAVDSSAASRDNLTELRQELAKNMEELESKKRENLKLAEKRRALEAEVALLRKQLLEQEKSALTVSQSSGSTVEQEQSAAE